MTEQLPGEVYAQAMPELHREAALPITLMNAVTRMKGVETPGQRFEIDKTASPITAGDLRTLMNLPYEVALHEDGGKTVLNRGDETDSRMVGATREARWMLHTHPFGSENTMPSSTDVLATWRHDHQHTTHMLVTSNGILTYRAPQHEPGHPEQPITDILRTFTLWGKDRGAQNMFWKPDELPNEERMAEMRQFVIDTGMLIGEAAWDDQPGLERALNIINNNGAKAVGDLAIEAARRVVDT